MPLEHVDLFPTLLDLAGLEQLPGLEGFSIKPLLDNPSLPWKKAAFSQYPRDGVPGPGHDESFPRVMGYTMVRAFSAATSCCPLATRTACLVASRPS